MMSKIKGFLATTATIQVSILQVNTLLVRDSILQVLILRNKGTPLQDILLRVTHHLAIPHRATLNMDTLQAHIQVHLLHITQGDQASEQFWLEVLQQQLQPMVLPILDMAVVMEVVTMDMVLVSMVMEVVTTDMENLSMGSTEECMDMANSSMASMGSTACLEGNSRSGSD